MDHKDNCKLKGTVEITNNTTNETVKFENLIVEVGWQQIFYLIGGSNTNSVTQFNVGTGTNTVSSSDTELQNENGEKLDITSYSVTSNKIEFNTTVLGSQKIFVWKEMGLFDSVGTLMARVNVDYNHSEGEQLNVKWTWERE